MARKHLLSSLLGAELPAGNRPAAAPAPEGGAPHAPLPGGGSRGAIGAVSRSIEQLKARKGRDGGIELAFGFDLAPLVARAEEFLALAERVRAEESAIRQSKERITICRREVTKGIAACIEEGVPATCGFENWEQALAEYRSIVGRMRRRASAGELEATGDEIEALADKVIKALQAHAESNILSGNESHSEHHIQNSKPENLIAFEPVLRKGQGTTTENPPEAKPRSPANVPLGLVTAACPDLCDYLRGGISTWRDVLVAATAVRPMLGISPSAWQDANDAMGELQAAIVVGCILQKGGAIGSPGGYLRALTQKAHIGAFSVGPMLMALAGGRKPPNARA